MIAKQAIESDDLPEPRGHYGAYEFHPRRLERIRRMGMKRLAPGEVVVWSFSRPCGSIDLWRASWLAFCVAAPMFVGLSLWGTQERSQELTIAVSLCAIMVLFSIAAMWRALRSRPKNLVPGFFAALTNKRLAVINLEKPTEVWSLCVGSVLQVSSDSMLHNHGGVWVSGWWIDPTGCRIETKIPVFVGKDSAAIVVMLRRRLTAECLEMPAEQAA